MAFPFLDSNFLNSDFSWLDIFPPGTAPSGNTGKTAHLWMLWQEIAYHVRSPAPQSPWVLDGHSGNEWMSWWMSTWWIKSEKWLMESTNVFNNKISQGLYQVTCMLTLTGVVQAKLPKRIGPQNPFHAPDSYLWASQGSPKISSGHSL